MAFAGSTTVLQSSDRVWLVIGAGTGNPTRCRVGYSQVPLPQAWVQVGFLLLFLLQKCADRSGIVICSRNHAQRKTHQQR
jgi:hypothetical protein